MRCCQEIWDTPKDWQDPSIFKLKELFEQGLKHGKEDGTVRLPLYSLFRFIAVSWAPQVQTMEGIDSLIKIATNRAPSIGQPLLDARAAITKALGLGKAVVSHTWSHVWPKAVPIQLECLQSLPDLPEVMHPRRFARPLPVLNIEPLYEAAVEKQYSNMALEWGKHNCSKFVKFYREAYQDAGQLVVIQEPSSSKQTPPTYYVCCLRYYTSMHMLEVPVSRGTDGRMRADLGNIGSRILLTDVLADAHNTLHKQFQRGRLKPWMTYAFGCKS